jgi:hypothetical protein
MHVKVNVLLDAVSGALVAEPVVGWLPLHAPLAAQDVALSEDQVSSMVAPFATVVGTAKIDTVGAAALTVTVVD